MAGNIITFDNVRFTYPGETEPLIKECSFALEERNHVAVKGEIETISFLSLLRSHPK